MHVPRLAPPGEPLPPWQHEITPHASRPVNQKVCTAPVIPLALAVTGGPAFTQFCWWTHLASAFVWAPIASAASLVLSCRSCVVFHGGRRCALTGPCSIELSRRSRVRSGSIGCGGRRFEWHERPGGVARAEEEPTEPRAERPPSSVDAVRLGPILRVRSVRASCHA